MLRLKEPRIRQPETVNTLFNVADGEKISPVCHSLENRLLHAVYVLIFVDHDLPVASPERPSHRVILKQAQGEMFQIRKIHNPLFSFGHFKPLAKGLSQSAQRRGCGAALPQIL